MIDTVRGLCLHSSADHKDLDIPVSLAAFCWVYPFLDLITRSALSSSSAESFLAISSPSTCVVPIRISRSYLVLPFLATPRVEWYVILHE